LFAGDVAGKGRLSKAATYEELIMLIETKLSPRQAELVNAVERLTKSQGFPPSLKELAAELGCSRGRAKQLADLAVKKGILLHDPRLARSWRVVRSSKPAR